MEAQQRGSSLDTAPVGLKQSSSFKGPSLLAKTGFHWGFNHRVLGTSLCSLHDPTSPTGRRVDGYPALRPPRGHGAMRCDQRATLQPSLPHGSYLFWQDAGPPQMQPRGRAAAQGHPLACMALIPLLPTARVPRGSSRGRCRSLGLGC